MSRDRRPNREFSDICSLAKMRAHVAFRTVEVLLPDADERRKKRICKKILSLCDGRDRSRKISPAQARDLVLNHVQCVDRNCPMLIFNEPLSRELNLFFESEEN
jgi:hypothetical protein